MNRKDLACNGLQIGEVGRVFGGMGMENASKTMPGVTHSRQARLNLLTRGVIRGSHENMSNMRWPDQGQVFPTL